jgi:hypothetical protein
MATDNLTRLVLQIDAGEDATQEDLNILTLGLLNELKDMSEVDEASLASGAPAPQGTKVADPVTIGALMVAVLPTFLPALVNFVQAWSMRGENRKIKFKGKVGQQEIEFEGTAEDLKALLPILGSTNQTLQ